MRINLFSNEDVHWGGFYWVNTERVQKLSDRCTGKHLLWNMSKVAHWTLLEKGLCDKLFSVNFVKVLEQLIYSVAKNNFF